MDKCGKFLRTTLCLLGFLVVGYNAITCYQCNSEFDPRCGDPFDPYTLGTVNCSMKKPPEHIKEYYPPVLCRKTIQKVQGKTRVIRGCGYIPDKKDNKECVRRTGTHDVQIHYCACTENLCNKSHRTIPSRIAIVLALVFTTTFAIRV